MLLTGAAGAMITPSSVMPRLLFVVPDADARTGVVGIVTVCWMATPAIQEVEAALNAVVLVIRVDLRLGGGGESLHRVSDVDVPVGVVHVPTGVVVGGREILDELTVEAVEVVAVEPDTGLVGARRDRRRAERPDLVVGRITRDRDLVTGGFGAIAQRAVHDGRVPHDRPVDEQGHVQSGGAARCRGGRLGRCCGVGGNTRRESEGGRDDHRRCERSWAVPKPGEVDHGPTLRHVAMGTLWTGSGGGRSHRPDASRANGPCVTAKSA